MMKQRLGKGLFNTVRTARQSVRGLAMAAVSAALMSASALSFGAAAVSSEYLVEAPVNLQDKVSLQNGAQIFVNNCLGCHSGRFMRYQRVAEDLGIPEAIAAENFLVGNAKIGDTMHSNLTDADSKKWFGAPPPDLSLTARLRGADWVYSYLIGFYADESRPWGYNNHIFDKVGMPHVLEGMERSLGEEGFKSAMADLTNFMVYMSEPIQMERQRLGVWVLLFIAIFTVFAYALGKEYWRDVK